MLLCFKLDASTLVDIFTKVIKNTKKNCYIKHVTLHNNYGNIIYNNTF